MDNSFMVNSCKSEVAFITMQILRFTVDSERSKCRGMGLWGELVKTDQ